MNPELALVIGRVRQAREKIGAWAAKAMAMEAAGVPHGHTPDEEAMWIVEGLHRAEMLLERLDKLEGENAQRT